jgi:hypothetical protein
MRRVASAAGNPAQESCMIWIHEISQSALAAAVATLGLVILLELRSISRLRRAVDDHLTRLFEQLDMLRFDSQQLHESQGNTAAPSVRAPTAPAAANAVAAYQPPALAGGEAKLLAAITAARARLGRAEGRSDVNSTA